MSFNHDNFNLTLPKRWLKCPRRGQLVAEKFIPFKTPLDDKYKALIPPADLFTPQMLIKSIASYKVNMGLWIDLTFTDRFYDKRIVEDAKIRYYKLHCRGHEECPTREQTANFVELCDNFINKNNNIAIGVHCTHGFNRTGFLICAYLIEKLGWSVDMAIAEFARARPPGIYKQDYIRELFVRYDDVIDMIDAPPLPDWCHEFDDSKEEKLNINGDSFKMVNGKRIKVIEGVSNVEMVTEPRFCSEIQRKCEQMCNWKNGFPGSQPVSMDRKNIERLHKFPYKVSWKADGTRFMMLVDGKDKHFFIDRDNCVFQIKGLTFLNRKESNNHLENTLLDGELVIQTLDNGEKIPRYLVYDIVKFNGQDVGGTTFDTRLICIQKEIIGPREEAKKNGIIDRNAEPFSVRQKDFWDINPVKNLTKLLSKEFEKVLCHEVDGLILQPSLDPYCPGQCDAVLKWKPPSLNSVDFKLQIVMEDKPGMLRTLVGNLMVVDKGNLVNFGVIKVNKDLKQYNNKIIECTYDMEENKWVFLRERTDKSFPNSYNTAFSVCQSIRYPITKEGLIDYIEKYGWRPSQKRPAENDEKTLMPPPKLPKQD